MNAVLPHIEHVDGPRRDRGVTLVEMLLSIALVGIIMGSVTSATIVLFRNTGTTTEQVAAAQDTRQLVSYFPGDVRSSERFAIHNGGRGVASGCTGVPANTRLHLELVSSDGSTRTEYRTANAGGRATLHRWVCSGSGGGAGTSVRLSDDLDPARPVTTRQVAVEGNPGSSRLEMHLHRISGSSIVVSATPFTADPPRSQP